MGDSHYRLRPEDTHYYNKSGKDLDAKFESLGAQEFVELGLGDGQDADPDTSFWTRSCGNQVPQNLPTGRS